MNYSKLYLLLLGACITASLQAHVFEFSNHTNEEVKIKIWLDLDPSWKWYEAVIAPKTAGHTKSQYNFKFGLDQGYYPDEAEFWKGTYCMREVQIQTPLMEKKEIIDDDGNTKATWVRAVSKKGKIPLWNPWRNLEILRIKDEGYTQMVNAGAMLADGLAEAAAVAATAATGTPIPAFKMSGIVKGAAGLYAYGNCKLTTHFDLIPTADENYNIGEKTVFNIIAITIAR